MIAVDEIFALFQGRGDGAYFGEPVTQVEHALQAAWHAARDGASPALIVAALLHDVGHLVHQRGEDIADRGVDARHELIGAKWLSRWFETEITEPIRLHVAAKRYLAGVEVNYSSQLSPASQQSLRLQGGPMSKDEINDFTRHAYWEAAIRLRRYDDAAKVSGLRVPALEDYRDQLRQAAR